MKKLHALLAVPVLLLGQLPASANELLLNGNLNTIAQVGDPNLYYPQFSNWTITTNPCSYSPCPITPYVPGAIYTQYSGYPALFADRTGSGYGLITTSFEGHYPFEIVGPVDIEISQTVAGTPGSVYNFSGWAHFQGGYAGGVEFLDVLSPNQRNQDAQAANPGVAIAALTDTIFALEFLDGIGNVLPNSIVYELHDDGGQQNDNERDGITWVQHLLSAEAPAGTVNVRVRAGMVDGEFNIDDPRQSAFFDDFSLKTALSVPEPGTLALTGLGIVLAVVARRRR